MACLHPSLVNLNGSHFLAPCRHCAACISTRVADLSFISSLELQKCYRDGFGASFVTLTYAPENTPLSSHGYKTLVKSDLQDFFKRLRSHAVRSGFSYPIKHISCGEYGKKDGLPHFHLVLIGLDCYTANQFIKKVWDKTKYGLIDVQALKSSSGLRYVCKYLSKSNPFGDIRYIYDSTGVQPPFVVHSQRLGFDWISKHAKDIVKNGYVFRLPQGLRLYPKSVRDLVFKLTGVSPKPFIEKYLKTINTGSLSLEDFQIEQVYNRCLDNHVKSIQSGDASSWSSKTRLPLALRPKFDWSLVNFDDLLSDVL